MLHRDALPDRFRRPRKRGEPLVMFAAVLMLWMGGRTATWESLSLATRPVDLSAERPAAPRLALQPWQGVPGLSAVADAPHDFAGPTLMENVAPGMVPPVLAEPLLPLPIAPLQPVALTSTAPLARLARARAMRAVTQQVLYMAAMVSLPLPAEMQVRPPRHRRLQPGRDGMGNITSVPVETDKDGAGELMATREKPLGQTAGRRGAERRWSGDGWLLMRQGGNDHALAGGSAPYGPTYGANQIGAVLRYRLIPGEAHKLTAYTRAYGALNGTGEREVAAGLSLRPLPAVPVIAMAEMRASQFQSGKTHARPAVSLVTEIPPVRLGGRLEAETYVQAGYVGGAAATPFIDGQIRVEQVVTRGGGAELRMGLGAWGGAQQGANRLDIGPTLRIGMRQGQVGARIAIDYRLRVQGNAMPTSGPALTLSAGF